MKVKFILIIFTSYVFASLGMAEAQCQTGLPLPKPNGIWIYPRSVPMSEAVERLNEIKAPSWLTAEAYHTDDSIKQVIQYFKKQTEYFGRKGLDNTMVESLMRDNWKLKKGLMAFPLRAFITGEEFRQMRFADKIESTLGVVTSQDSIVRVHLMSPHPDSKNPHELIPGTMITIIKERMPSETQASEVDEKAYTGVEVTRKARIRNKPTPDHPGGSGYTVVLKAILASNGKVTRIVIVQGRPADAFTQAAIKAARKIIFDPAIKDGRYVSQWVQLEYSFFP